MSSQFDYDWFHGPAFERQKREARLRCTLKKCPGTTSENLNENTQAREFFNALEVRVMIYLRDGFSYEMKEMVDLGTPSLLTFECEPVDEQYRVGSFVVALQYEEIVRVEVYAVHPSEKPDDMPVITGFRTSPSDLMAYREEQRDGREPRSDTRDDALSQPF